jgi:DNA sulfur modification protein DndC
MRKTAEALIRAERSLEAVQAVLAQGAETFVLTYSGGKDSTATAVLTLEWWKKIKGEAER